MAKLASALELGCTVYLNFTVLNADFRFKPILDQVGEFEELAKSDWQLGNFDIVWITHGPLGIERVIGAGRQNIALCRVLRKCRADVCDTGFGMV